MAQAARVIHVTPIPESERETVARGPRHLSPYLVEVNRIAILLMREWERVEHEPVNASFVATFADMARVIVRDRGVPLEGAPIALRVFTNGTDTFVACDIEDAKQLQIEHHGGGTSDDFVDFDDLSEVASDKPIRITIEEEECLKVFAPEVSFGRAGGRVMVTKFAAAWAIANGRGLLCSTEY